MKRYLITAVVLLIAASAYATWRAGCTAGCHVNLLVLGLPVFLTTPIAPGTGTRPEFSFVPLIINVVWSAAASVSFWAVVETLGRWQDRRREPPLV